MTGTTNDNDTAETRLPDPHGQAAMLLVESLIHGLIARSVISAGDAIEIVAVAADAKREIAFRLGDAPAVKETPLALLTGIAKSLENDAKPRSD